MPYMYLPFLSFFHVIDDGRHPMPRLINVAKEDISGVYDVSYL